MPLVKLNLEISETALPGEVRSFLREAERRIERFQKDSRIPGFVASDFERAYCVLRAMSASSIAPGNLFCEWGSGFGVIACLAAMLDFDACGIEVESVLVDAARALAEDFDLPVEFVRGSFIPEGGEALVTGSEGFGWLTTDEGDTAEELGLVPEDFDIIFAYPWPDEEGVTAELFDRYSSVGAVLMTYHGGEDFRLRRKIGTKQGRWRTEHRDG